MQKWNYYLQGLALVAMLAMFTLPGRAEVNSTYMSSGNNIAFYVTKSYGGGLRGPHQFPAGSGNTIAASRWSHCVDLVRDLDGDGSIEDTLYSTSRGGWLNGQNATLEDYDALKAIFDTGVFMENGAQRPEVSQIWSSKDAEDLADWPIQFREGRSESGDPITFGAETISYFRSDVFNEDARLRTGASFETSFYFMNFAESNNMIYSHTFIRNMSEYMAWNADITEAGLIPAGFAGSAWHQWQLIYSAANIQFGGGRPGWGFHPSKVIQVHLDENGTNSGFTNGYTPFVAHQILKYPSHNGETMDFTNIGIMRWSTTYGFNNQVDLLESGRPPGKIWKFGLGDAGDLYDYQLNPYTGEVAKGFPGDLRGTAREDEWAYGKNGYGNYSFYGTLSDFEPRDSCSFDCVYMFAWPSNPPAVLPDNVISNIGDADFMAQFSTLDHYADVARVVYEGGYILPAAPEPPPLTIVPGDRQVTITWSDINLTTPDPYGTFLQENGLDPEGLYKIYDFEGFRLYRSFVGPSDSHSEMLWEGSLSDGNLLFHFVDNIDDDELRRMRNGMKVWYAIEAYDSNVDPVSGESFSLPEEGSGKAWYGSPQNGLYTVLPRSDASEYKAATISNTIVYEGPATLDAISVELAGDGTGKLTEAPKWLVPQLGEVEFTPILNESLSSDKSVYIECSDYGDIEDVNWGGCNYPTAQRTINISDANGTGWGVLLSVRNREDEVVTLTLDSPTLDDGVEYTLTAQFQNIAQGDWREASEVCDYWDTGSYSGASIDAARYRCGERLGSAPNILGWTREGQYSVTWKDAGGGMLSVDIHDDTRNVDVPFGAYMDDLGWGFAPNDGTIGDRWGGDNLFNDLANDVPRAERTNQMSQTIAADNTEEFGVYLAGIFWVFSGITEMPAPGTVMKCVIAFGQWNDDMTVFTQSAPPPWQGDKWKIDINASTLDADDADLSKIRVVPNPYLASSMLDIGPASRRIEFVNLPGRCTIRIYTLSGNLVNVLNHVGANRQGWGNYTDWDELDLNSQPKEYTGYDNHSGTEPWNLKNRFGQLVASGCYFYHVTDTRGETQTGAFYIVN